jgi:hypothetical protein
LNGARNVPARVHHFVLGAVAIVVAVALALNYYLW